MCRCSGRHPEGGVGLICNPTMRATCALFGRVCVLVLQKNHVHTFPFAGDDADEVDTEMDLPLAMDRPNTEAATPGSVTISFFAPRPTLPKMKIQRFVLQVQY